MQRLFPTTTATGRALRLAGLTAGVTGSYIGYLAQRLLLGEEQRDSKRRSAHARAGRRIREELQLLRGPVMKFGQALSLHTMLYTTLHRLKARVRTSAIVRRLLTATAARPSATPF